MRIFTPYYIYYYGRKESYGHIRRYYARLEVGEIRSGVYPHGRRVVLYRPYYRLHSRKRARSRRPRLQSDRGVRCGYHRRTGSGYGEGLPRHAGCASCGDSEGGARTQVARRPGALLRETAGVDAARHSLQERHHRPPKEGGGQGRGCRSGVREQEKARLRASDVHRDVSEEESTRSRLR